MSAETPKVCEQVFRKARPMRIGVKPEHHSCCECRRSIRRGQWHSEVSGLWDTSWCHYRICLRCHARHEAHRELDTRFAPFGQLGRWIRELLHEMGREHWKDYGTAFRLHLSNARAVVRGLDKLRAERYRKASVEREERKKALMSRGEGI